MNGQIGLHFVEALYRQGMFSSAQNCKTDTSPAFLYVDSFLQRRQLEDQVNMCL